MSLVMAVMYWVIRDFGADAQAGLAEGQGAMRFIMLPAMAVAFAAAPIAGQNFGARKPERVRETFNWTVGMSIAIMLALTVLCQFDSHLLHAHFHVRRSGGVRRRDDAHDHARGTSPRTASSSAARRCSRDSATPGRPSARASFVCSCSSCRRSGYRTQPHFDLVHVWYLSVCSMFLQAVVSFALLRREFRRKLTTRAGTRPRKWGHSSFPSKQGRACAASVQGQIEHPCASHRLPLC